MRIDILTLFPPLFESVFSKSIIKKAIEKKIVDVKITDIRKFTTDRHKTVDDKAYGGGAGMLMMAPPIVDAIKSVKHKGKSCRVILLSPQGKVFNQQKAKELANLKHIVLVCGHYGGVDERILKFVDAVSRLIPNVVGKVDSVENDSLWDGKLISPMYTRPYDFRGLKVPKILLSGNHKEIEKWKKDNAINNTIKKRPELLRIKNGGQNGKSNKCC